MVQATWRNRHPGSFLIPAEYLRFHSSTSALPFLHVPPTLAPNVMFQWTVLAVQNWPKNCWPWMTFLSRSNTGRRFFQFATEEFKCRPLKCYSMTEILNDWNILRMHRTSEWRRWITSTVYISLNIEEGIHLLHSDSQSNQQVGNIATVTFEMQSCL